MKFIITTLLLLFKTLRNGLLTAQVPPMNQQMTDLPTSADVSDEELSQLPTPNEQLEPIQLEAESKIAETLESEGIIIVRFQQMMMAMQNPQMADQVNITEDEMQKVQQIQPDLMDIQGEA